MIKLYTARKDDITGEPVLTTWWGLIDGENVFVTQKQHAVSLARHPAGRFYKSAGEAFGSLKPKRGFAIHRYNNKIVPALVFRDGSRKLLARDNDGARLGTGYTTKRAAALAILKDMSSRHKRLAAEAAKVKREMAKLRAVR